MDCGVVSTFLVIINNLGVIRTRNEVSSNVDSCQNMTLCPMHPTTPAGVRDHTVVVTLSFFSLLFFFFVTSGSHHKKTITETQGVHHADILMFLHCAYICAWIKKND